MLFWDVYVNFVIGAVSCMFNVLICSDVHFVLRTYSVGYGDIEELCTFLHLLLLLRLLLLLLRLLLLLLLLLLILLLLRRRLLRLLLPITINLR